MSCNKRSGLLRCVDVRVCENASHLASLIVVVSNIHPLHAAERLTVLFSVCIGVCNLYPCLAYLIDDWTNHSEEIQAVERNLAYMW